MTEGADPRPARRSDLRRAALAGPLAAALLLILAAGALAQAPPVESPGRILPPLPAPPQRELEVSPRVRVFVRRVEVLGSTVFSPEELAQVTSRYVNRALTTEDLQALRLELTKLYVDRGFVTSGVLLPDQTVKEGTVVYQAIEGSLAAVEITGNRWFRTGYLRQRLEVDAPLNVNDLQRRIQVLLDDARIRRITADLKPGLRPGEGVLDVRVEDRHPFRLTLDVNNHQAPSVGAERGIVTVEDLNLLGWGDTLAVRYGRSDGVDPLLDFRYAAPVTPWDTTVAFQYRRNTLAVLDELFSELEIESESEIFTVSVRQPLYHTPQTLLAAEIVGERLEETTFLLGEPFPLLPGSRRGETIVTAMRGSLDFVHRSQNQVVALRSRVSIGTTWLGATIHNERKIPDSRFFAWLGQAQVVRRLPFLDAQLIARTDLQLTRDPLLTLEQISVGGRASVRGYRENTIVRDNAFIGSVELRLPLVRGTSYADYIELAPFYDYGRAWNSREDTTPDPQDISSAGLGLRWALTIPGVVSLRPQFEVYFGYRFRTVRITGEPDRMQDLLHGQDTRGKKGVAGLHFQFLLTAF